MRRFFKYCLFLILFIFHAAMFSVVNYVFPHYDVTRVTGVGWRCARCVFY